MSVAAVLIVTAMPLSAAAYLLAARFQEGRRRRARTAEANRRYFVSARARAVTAAALLHRADLHALGQRRWERSRPVGYHSRYRRRSTP